MRSSVSFKSRQSLRLQQDVLFISLKVLLLAAVQAATASSGQLNPWKSKRRCTEWRLRWLELRLRELKYQQTRYEHLLQLVQNPAAAADHSAAQPSTAALPQEASSSLAEEVGLSFHPATIVATWEITLLMGLQQLPVSDSDTP